jgi:CBS domain-containing protein
MASTVQTHPLISIRDSATVQEAARLMADCSIGALGILDKDREFAGIITERDLSWFVAQGKEPGETAVAEIANDYPVVVEGPIGDAEALERMRETRVRHLIVHERADFRILSMRDFVLKTASDGSPTYPTAADAMTAPAVACRDETFLEEVVEVLADRDISGMPVINADGAVVGVISERDLACALGGPIVRLALRRHNEKPLQSVAELPRGDRRVRSIMTAPALTVSPREGLEEVARLMRINQINRIPVIEDGFLVGVVTRGDVLGAVAHLAHESIDVTRPPVLVGSASTQGRGM